MALPTLSSRSRALSWGKLAQSPAAQTCGALVWPTDLAVYYPFPAGGASAAAAAGATILLLALTALAVAAARRAPWGLVGWLWFLGALVPMMRSRGILGLS